MSDAPQPNENEENPYESPTAEKSAASGSPAGQPSKEDCNSAMLAHLLGALLGIIGPLIIFLTKKDDSPFVEKHAKEAVNFHLTLIIAYLVSTVLWTILAIVTCGIGGMLPIPAAVWVWQIVMGIIASTKANSGESYEYPLTIRMIQ